MLKDVDEVGIDLRKIITFGHNTQCGKYICRKTTYCNTKNIQHNCLPCKEYQLFLLMKYSEAALDFMSKLPRAVYSQTKLDHGVGAAPTNEQCASSLEVKEGGGRSQSGCRTYVGAVRQEVRSQGRRREIIEWRSHLRTKSAPGGQKPRREEGDHRVDAAPTNEQCARRLEAKEGGRRSQSGCRTYERTVCQEVRSQGGRREITEWVPHPRTRCVSGGQKPRKQEAGGAFR